MHATILVNRTLAKFDGTTWKSPDPGLASLLNSYDYMGEVHSEYGRYGSHVQAIVKRLHGKILVLEDTPTDVSDVI